MKVSCILSISRLLIDLCVIRQKIIKNTFADMFYYVLQEYEKVCLKINGKQSVKLRIGSINFKIISNN